ncbi:hypothetical protein HDU97_004729 [Phlyctochytrium planicorne]|nr:hypothetical protein HDU97_004729 [Phlyctochytrium planicorne]
MACTCHRIFLAALVIATKFLHDRPIRNRAWAFQHAEELFSLQDLNLMERQLMGLLEFRMWVREGEVEELSRGVLGDLEEEEEEEDDGMEGWSEDEEEEEEDLEVKGQLNNGGEFRGLVPVDSGVDVRNLASCHPSLGGKEVGTVPVDIPAGVSGGECCDGACGGHRRRVSETSCLSDDGTVVGSFAEDSNAAAAAAAAAAVLVGVRKDVGHVGFWAREKEKEDWERKRDVRFGGRSWHGNRVVMSSSYGGSCAGLSSSFGGLSTSVGRVGPYKVSSSFSGSVGAMGRDRVVGGAGGRKRRRFSVDFGALAAIEVGISKKGGDERVFRIEDEEDDGETVVGGCGVVSPLDLDRGVREGVEGGEMEGKRRSGGMSVGWWWSALMVGAEKEAGRREGEEESDLM